MAKGKGEINGWITKNGIHIPIYGTYTARGGEEPRAKGSKFKGNAKSLAKKKKKEEDAKYLEQYASRDSEGLTRKERLRRAFGEDVESSSNDYKSRSDTGETRKERLNRAAEEMQAVREKYKDKKSKRGMTNAELDAANAELDKKDALADMEAYEKTHPLKKGTSFKDKKAQELGFADDASMRSYNAETGVNKESWKNLEDKTGRKDFRNNLNKIMDSDDYEAKLAEVDKMTANGTSYSEAVKSVANSGSKQQNGEDTSTITATAVKSDAERWKDREKAKRGKKIGQNILDNTSSEKEASIKKNGWLQEGQQLKRTGKSNLKSFGQEPAASELGKAQNEANAAKTKFAGMSVTALKSAYKNALGSERGAIYQILKRKGYSFVGGKWVKG